MNKELERELLKKIEELQKQVNKLEGKSEENIPTFSFSQIDFQNLKNIVELKQSLNDNIFDNWFKNNISITKNDEMFLLELIEKNRPLIKQYSEEDLKIKFISKLLNYIDFQSYENEFREFYELFISYKTKKFIFAGNVDFAVSKGLIYSQKPYFFIQEFKKGVKGSDPEPQLLAQLIAGVELNNETTIKGAYIVGSIWNFVILEKLQKNKYKYYVSQNFDSTKIKDLKDIYKNLVFVKDEIIKNINISTTDKKKILK